MGTRVRNCWGIRPADAAIYIVVAVWVVPETAATDAYVCWLCSFPAAHVTFRLESSAAGSWPRPGPAAPDTRRVAMALSKVRSGLSAETSKQSVWSSLICN